MKVNVDLRSKSLASHNDLHVELMNSFLIKNYRSVVMLNIFSFTKCIFLYGRREKRFLDIVKFVVLNK